MTNEKPTFCINCGHKHEQESFPKKCSNCNHEMYLNPIPVAVVCVPVNDNGKKGILVVKRNIDPHIGEWALIGGYVDNKETAIDGGIREVFEEAGLIVSNLKLMGQCSSFTKKNILLFFVSNMIDISELSKFKPNFETQDIRVAYEPEELCFSAHTEYLAKALELIKNEN